MQKNKIINFELFCVVPFLEKENNENIGALDWPLILLLHRQFES